MRTDALAGADLRRRDVSSPVRDVLHVRHAEPDVAVNAGAGIPARVGEPRMIHPHGDDIFRRAEFQIGRQVKRKAGITVGPRADEHAVDPDLREIIDAVELDGDVPAFLGGVELEMFAIPAEAARRVAVAARVIRAERPGDAPVVRHVHAPPVGVVECRHGGRREIAQAETPVEIKIRHRPGARGVRAGQGQQRDQPDGKPANEI